MICPNCSKECLPSDFLPKQTDCYRCVYKSKNVVKAETKKKKECLCKICGDEITNDKDVKKRQRNVYCSEQCAQKGHKNTNENYWTRKFREAHPLNSQFYA